MSHRERRTYDHRIKAQIIAAGDPTLFPELGIPRSTAVSWIRRGVGAAVTIEDDSPSELPLRDRVASLEYRISVLIAVLRLVLALLRVSGFKLQLLRIVSADAKRRLLGAVERAREVMPLEAALRVLGLSAARYHEWIGRQRSCTLDDHSSCPRSRPQRLTFEEVEAIGELVQSNEYRHVSVRTLALRAQRDSRVYAIGELGRS